MTALTQPTAPGRLGPPDRKEWPPERLFRLLTKRPRPTLPLPSLSFAPQIQLAVRAYSSAEEGSWADQGPRHALAAIVQATVLWRGVTALTEAQVSRMLPRDFAELTHAVAEAHAVASPTYTRCDTDAWFDVLLAGARHHTNYSTAILLGQSYDWTGGGEQPDRYFGVPLADLTDGQVMAYRAALRVCNEMRKR